MDQSYYQPGMSPQFQQTSPSAQGLPINIMSGAQSGGSPSWQAPSLGALSGSAPGQDTYAAVQNSPQWLQNFYQGQEKQAGSQGYYDPTLQMRDIQNQYQPQVAQAYNSYGASSFQNPWFASHGMDPGSNPGFNPFTGGQISGNLGGYGALQQLTGENYPGTSPFEGANGGLDATHGTSQFGYSSDFMSLVNRFGYDAAKQIVQGAFSQMQQGRGDQQPGFNTDINSGFNYWTGQGY